jgi:hypothetical protein
VKNQSRKASGLGLDCTTAEFKISARQIANAMLKGEELRTREAILGSAYGVIVSLLRTMQYPRDLCLIGQLAELNIALTGYLDHIVLNASQDDRPLLALRQLAKGEPVWPTSVRPGDEKFTQSKMQRLELGSQKPLGTLKSNAKRPASLATDRNRLTLVLVNRIQNRAQAVLYVKPITVNQDGSVEESGIKEASEDVARNTLRMCEPGISEKDYGRILGLLRDVKKHPLSVRTLKKWSHFLTEFVLMADPKLERFAELKSIRSEVSVVMGQCSEGDKRSKLQKFFNPALKHLANQP